jgi:hypothetical protein
MIHGRVPAGHESAYAPAPMKLPAVLLLAALVACSHAPTGPDLDAGAGSEAALHAPSPPAKTDARVTRVAARRDVSLTGLRVDAKPGDWMIQGGGSVAVVSATRGNVVDFGADGGEDALVWIQPTVYIGIEDQPSVVESVGPAGVGGYSVLVKRRILSDPALVLWTYVTLADGALRIESVAAAPDKPAIAVTVGEIVAWGNVPTWVEGHGFATEEGSWAGDFMARQGLGMAYALATDEGHVVARFGKPLVGFHPWPHTGEIVETLPAGGSSRRRAVVVTQSRGSLGAAVAKLPRVQAGGTVEVALPAGLPPGAWAEAATCGGTLPFARFGAADGPIHLPKGCFRVRLGAPGYATGDWVDSAATASAPLPQAGQLHWHVREKGGAVVPARVLVRGAGTTPDPDWGEDAWDGASRNVVYTDRDGDLPVPPGHYHVTVTRGFEYTRFDGDVSVPAGGSVEVAAQLDRVVDTSGWIAADLHVHAAPSPDAPVPLVDRARSLAASGVEVAVATDHNKITDYTSAIAERGLGPWLTSIVGDEVTTYEPQLGHYNVFPLQAGQDPVAFETVGAPAVVASSRAALPAGDKVVQLNHPRMGSIGYFDLLRFDPRDVQGWKSRSPLAETGFDAIEVFNGDHYADVPAVEKVMKDWYALLDAGVHVTATGNSDSHRVTYHECGVPRNLVRVGDDAPPGLDKARFVDAVRAGHVVVSSGPFVRVDVNGAGPGDTVAAGPHAIEVTVDAPPWIDVSRVELVVHGVIRQTWNGPFAAGKHRFDATLKEALAPGDWVIAIARGDKEMDFLPRKGAKPFGFTNPVWVK